MTVLLKQMAEALRYIENAATDQRVQRYEIRAAATEALAKLDAQAAEQAGGGQQVRELPPLPTEWRKVEDADGIEVPVFRAFQMWDYARAAIAAFGSGRQV